MKSFYNTTWADGGVRTRLESPEDYFTLAKVEYCLARGLMLSEKTFLEDMAKLRSFTDPQKYEVNRLLSEVSP